MNRCLMGAGFIALAMLPDMAFAFECQFSPENPEVSLRWRSRNIEWGIRAGSETDLDELTLNAAFSTWSQPACTDLQFQYVGIVSQVDPVNQVVAITSGWSNNRPAEMLMATQSEFQASTGLLTKVVIEVNLDFYILEDVEQSCSGNAYDLQAVMTHEVGHLIGLGHTQEWSGTPDDPTMAPTADVCETDKRTLEEDDRQAVCFLYPMNGPARQCGEDPNAQLLPQIEDGCGCRTVDAFDANQPWGALLGLLALAGIRRRMLA